MGGFATINHPICGDHPGKIHFTKHLDDAGTTNAGNAGGGNRRVKPILIRPLFDTDHPKPRFQGIFINTDTLNGAGRSTLTR